jgi:toxin ParE1/3/4
MVKIRWADPAIQDLDIIADYIALDKPAVASQLVRQVITAIEKLQFFPEMGSHPKELRGLPYRQLVVPPCRIFYRIEKQTVFIVHIFRGEQLVKKKMFLARPAASKSPNKTGPADRKKRGG